MMFPQLPLLHVMQLCFDKLKRLDTVLKWSNENEHSVFVDRNKSDFCFHRSLGKKHPSCQCARILLAHKYQTKAVLFFLSNMPLLTIAPHPPAPIMWPTLINKDLWVDSSERQEDKPYRWCLHYHSILHTAGSCGANYLCAEVRFGEKWVGRCADSRHTSTLCLLKCETGTDLFYLTRLSFSPEF